MRDPAIIDSLCACVRFVCGLFADERDVGAENQIIGAL
jgi:hypothetical protein